MESAVLGLALDSSVLIAAERRNLTAAQAVKAVRGDVGELPLVLCSLTVAEIGHGIYRAHSQEVRNRRKSFLADLQSNNSCLSGDGCYGRDCCADRWTGGCERSQSTSRGPYYWSLCIGTQVCDWYL